MTWPCSTCKPLAAAELQSVSRLILAADASAAESADGNSQPSAFSSAVGDDGALSSIALKVGDTARLRVIARLKDGSLAELTEDCAKGRLRVKASDYSVWACFREGLLLTARQISSGPVTVSVCLRTSRFSLKDGIKQDLEVKVGLGWRFVAFTKAALPGVPLAFWQYGRRSLRTGWPLGQPCRQYTIDGSIFSMPAQSCLEAVGWASCGDLASGWQPAVLHAAVSADDGTVSCELDQECSLFSLKSCRPRKRAVSIDVCTGDGQKHCLRVKVLAAPQREWQGLTESPLFKSRRRCRLEKLGGTVLGAVGIAITIVLLYGCLMAQISRRGVWEGIGYTAYMLGTGLALLMAGAAAMLLFSALAFALLRRRKRSA